MWWIGFFLRRFGKVYFVLTQQIQFGSVETRSVVGQVMSVAGSSAWYSLLLYHGQPLVVQKLTESRFGISVRKNFLHFTPQALRERECHEGSLPLRDDNVSYLVVHCSKTFPLKYSFAPGWRVRWRDLKMQGMSLSAPHSDRVPPLDWAESTVKKIQQQHKSVRTREVNIICKEHSLSLQFESVPKCKAHVPTRACTLVCLTTWIMCRTRLPAGHALCRRRLRSSRSSTRSWQSPPPFPAVGCWLCAGEQRIWAFLQVLCPLEMHVHVFVCIYLCVGVRACGAFRPQLALKT